MSFAYKPIHSLIKTYIEKKVGMNLESVEN